jgi:hypothetical protein
MFSWLYLNELLFAVEGNYHHAPSQGQTRNEKTEAGSQVEKFETIELEGGGSQGACKDSSAEDGVNGGRKVRRVAVQ